MNEGLAFQGQRVPAWVSFGGLVTSEYLLLSFLVDARDLLRPAGLEQSLREIGSFAPLLFVSGAALFLTGGHALRLRLRVLSEYRPNRRSSCFWGLAHAGSFAAVLSLALQLASWEANTSGALRWLVLWSFLVVAALSTLLLSLWQARTLFAAALALRRELAVGIGVGVLAWGAGLFSRRLWQPAAGLTLEVVHALLTLLASDPVASIEDAIVGTSRFYVEVAPVCSGVEGVGLMLIFVGAFLLGRRRELRWPQAAVLLPLAALTAWSLNVVRVTALIAVGTWVSPSVALGGFHSKAGWIFFTITALGSVWVAQRWPWLHREESGAAVSRAPSPVTGAATPHAAAASRDATAAYLVPLLAVLATQLLTGLMSSGLNLFYPLSVLAAALALFAFREHFPMRPELRASDEGRSGASTGGKKGAGSPDAFARGLALPSGVGLAVGLLWVFGFQRSGEPSQLAEWVATAPGIWVVPWLLLRALGSIVTVPIVEELAFRGYLLRRFVSADFASVPYRRFSWLGLVVSSIAFGLLHSQWQLGLIAGFVFGALVVVRGRLRDGIVAHAVANGLIALVVVLTGDWALWG